MKIERMHPIYCNKCRKGGYQIRVIKFNFASSTTIYRANCLGYWRGIHFSHFIGGNFSTGAEACPLHGVAGDEDVPAFVSFSCATGNQVIGIVRCHIVSIEEIPSLVIRFPDSLPLVISVVVIISSIGEVFPIVVVGVGIPGIGAFPVPDTHKIQRDVLRNPFASV